ncbi:hypothetical protein GZL_06005 [Streptomyces sp. 769]|nr:hypothetical protein GZL_06005 [Streptomyces sp. 769]
MDRAGFGPVQAAVVGIFFVGVLVWLAMTYLSLRR